jgi:hypothetical protein
VAAIEGWPNYKMEESISKVESLAMIAKVPRKLVHRYSEALRDAYDSSGDGPHGPETSPECLEEIRAATEVLVGYLWNPVRYRLRGKLRGRRLPERAISR